jgi:multiple sugar transport system permease protein
MSELARPAQPIGTRRLDPLARLRRAGYGWTFIGVVLVLIYLFPVYWMVSTALKSDADIYANPPKLFPSPIEWENIREAVIDNPPVLKAIRSSAIISVGTMLLTLLLAAPAAYALARLRPRGGVLFLLLLLVTQLLPGIVIASPLFVVFRWIEQRDFLAGIELIDTYWGLIIADTTIALPFAVIILRPFFLAVPMELESAALVDGSTRLGAFWRIVLPLVRPGLVTVAVFSFLFTWGEFVFGLTLVINNEDIQPVTVALNNFIGQYGTQWNLLMTVAATVALPIIVVFAALQRFIVGGLTTGATKE